jgi:hypothetical protein
MADVTSVSQTYSNAGVSIAGGVLGLNFEQIVNTQGLSGRLLAISIEKDAGDMTEAQLVAVLKAITLAGGSGSGTDDNGPDAFTVVGISDFDGSDPVNVLLQGTGTLNATPVTGYTITTVATYALAV